MNEVEFRGWLEESGKNRRVIGDTISRMKKLQRELGINLDDEFKKDKCETIMNALTVNKGDNDIMKKYGDVNLPIGKFTLGTYRYSLKSFIAYKESR